MKKIKNRNKIRQMLVATLVVFVLLIAVWICVVRVSDKSHKIMAQDTLETMANFESEAVVEVEIAETLHRDEQEEYEKIVGAIEAGNSIAVAEMLINGEIARPVIVQLKEEDANLLDYVLTDALVEYTNQGKVEELVRLRLGGYVSDACLYNYWEVIGARLPDEEWDYTDVDCLLIHELAQAYSRDEYSIRSFREMQANGLLDDAHHDALVEQLGFVYTDDQFLKESNISALWELSEEEKIVYDAILQFADEGDCRSVAMKMVCGEVTELVYTKLITEDKEMMDHIIAQAMGGFSEENAYNYSVLLRQNGFVSNECFQIYWEVMGTDSIDGETYNNDFPGVDRYLLHELEQVYHRDHEYGLEALRMVRHSGLISDPIHEQLIVRLGFNYMETNS